MSHGRTISVTGLGYVGLPVAVAFGKQGRVVGFDINATRIAELRAGHDSTREVDTADLMNAEILFTSQPEDLQRANFHIVAVPTPIDDAKQPDLRPLLAATEAIGKQLKRGDIVVYESTVYPGATEEDCLPILERESGLVCGKDFHIGYSPERINPGDRTHGFTAIQKVVSAQSEDMLDIIADVYGSVVTAGVYKAPAIKVAEAAKVIENTQRDLNIALMNELVLVFDRLGIDTHDVLAAARTKWNFLPFTPGLVGGHCIGVDPYYLTYKAAMLGYTPQVILSGRSINDGMGMYIANRVVKALIHDDCVIRGATVTVLGLAFKENVPDLRNTRVTDIVHELKSFGINVQVNDPLLSIEEARSTYGIDLVPMDRLQPAAAVILAVPHREYLDADWTGITNLLNNNTGVVFDVKSVLPRQEAPDGVTLYRL